MATAELVLNESHPLLDDFDETILSIITEAGRISLQALLLHFPDRHYSTLKYRVRTLSDWGVIRIAKARRGKLICFATHEGE